MNKLTPFSQKPRDYQLEAAKYALKKKRCVCVLPTGTGKTLIGVIWVSTLLKEGKAKRFLVLEPTRYLVEQVASYYRVIGRLDAKPVHGGLSRWERERGWRSKIVVATPEIVLSDLSDKEIKSFDAIVVDECHHTTGQDAYAKLIDRIEAEYRLGLSAFIPRSRRKEIMEYIGEIKSWSLSDPRIKKYVPEWIGEIYESPLNEAEKRIYDYLLDKYKTVERKFRSVVRLAIRFFVRDGAIALLESLERQGKMWELLDGKLIELLKGVRPAHKIGSLKRILRDHEGFNKAIIFVDRVTLAFHISRELEKLGLKSVVLCGKTRREKSVKEILRDAKDPSTSVIVSTSAGEEGIDLPEADLLIIWSNIVSPLRFIQRHGRLLRKKDKRIKFVAYLVTPDTPDADSFIDAIYLAKKAGIDVPISSEVLKELVKKSVKARIVELLEDRPLPLEWIAEVLGLSPSETRRHISFLQSSGEVVYFYTHLGKTYVAKSNYTIVLEEYDEWFKPKVKESIADVKLKKGLRSRRLKGTLAEILHKLDKLARHIFDRIEVSVQVYDRTLKAYHLVNLVYNYPIDDIRLLKLVLKNSFAYSEQRLKLL